MKKFIFFLVLQSFSVAFSQIGSEQEALIKAEQSRFRSQVSTLKTTLPDTSGFDVLHYTLDMNVNPNVADFSGFTIIKLKALQSITSITLNAKNTLAISSVEYNNVAVTSYTHSSNVLQITLPSALATNNIAYVKVYYNGSTNTSSGLTRNYHAGVPVVANLSESFHASSWWICKDNLSDKADEGVDVYVTHPSTDKCGSNGLLQSVTDVGSGNVKTYWKSTYPIVPYLVSIALTNYVEYSNSVTINGTTIPIVNYVYPEELSSHQSNLNNVPTYMNFFSTKFGDYPFKNEKYGHCQWEWGGGMEHQTMSSMVDFSQNLTAHELAHQWFGDKITCGTWKDIWLNEGFASYLTALVMQNIQGEIVFYNWREYVVNYITSQNNGSVYINNDADALDEGRIFNGRLTYDKGAMVLHMLRFKMGDTAFFQAMHNYANDSSLAYTFAITTDFRTHVEAVYGSSLVEFFADWVFGEGHPIFDVALYENSGNNNKYIIFNQSQSHSSVGFFETPIDIKFVGSNGETLMKTFSITQNNQQFDFSDVPFQVASYTVNPNYNIVCKVNSAITLLSIDELSAQAKVQLYPNPVSDALSINSIQKINSIELYASTGQLVKTISASDYTVTIDVSTLISGSYYAVIQTTKSAQKIPFLKK